MASASNRNIAIENQRETWGTSFQADEAFDISNGITPLVSWAVAYKDTKTGAPCNYNKGNTVLQKYGEDPRIINWYAITSKVGKPLMQAETGAGYNQSLDPEPMTDWIDDAYAAVKDVMPAMKAFLWWSAVGDDDYNLQPSRGGTRPGLLTYETMARDPYFGATSVAGYFSSAGASGGPTAPTGLDATWSGDTATVSWRASTDPLAGIDHYDVYRNGVVVGTSTAPACADSVGTSGTSVSYTVDAVDSALNRSILSAARIATSP